VRAVLVAALLIVTGGILWQILQLESTSPTATIPTASRLPTSTPDERVLVRLMTVEALVTQAVPTPTSTPRPPRTPQPTHTPWPQYGTESCTAGILCQQWSPTATPSPWPTKTPAPPPMSCGTVAPNGDVPRYCWGNDDA
jgi:hypothetical protein